MNQKEYLKRFKETTDTMYAITSAKNADYSWEDNVDAFANFRVVEAIGAASVEQWFITRITDKLTRITNLTKQKAHVKDEAIEDTLLDLANYSILFKLFLEDKNAAVK